MSQQRKRDGWRCFFPLLFTYSLVTWSWLLQPILSPFEQTEASWEQFPHFRTRPFQKEFKNEESLKREGKMSYEVCRWWESKELQFLLEKVQQSLKHIRSKRREDPSRLNRADHGIESKTRFVVWIKEVPFQNKNSSLE